jgi:quercetin dioxygenase-like cupin family protein
VEIKHVTLNDLPEEAINEKLTRQMLFGEKGNIGIFVYKKGAIVPTHHHPNEQFSIITRGSCRVTVEGKEYIVSAGQAIIIPPNAHHSFEALEDDTYDIDFFSPARQDWLAGTDSYLGH